MSTVTQLKRNRVRATVTKPVYVGGTSLSVVFQGEVHILTTKALAKAINSGNDDEAERLVTEQIEEALNMVSDGADIASVTNVDIEWA